MTSRIATYSIGLAAVLFLASCATKAKGKPGEVFDEARRANRTAASLPQADEDYFHDMDGGSGEEATAANIAALYLPVLRLLVTLCTLPTPLAAMPATFLSISFATTPSNVTSPFLTIMWIGGTAPNW